MSGYRFPWNRKPPSSHAAVPFPGSGSLWFQLCGFCARSSSLPVPAHTAFCRLLSVQNTWAVSDHIPPQNSSHSLLPAPAWVLLSLPLSAQFLKYPGYRSLFQATGPPRMFYPFPWAYHIPLLLFPDKQEARLPHPGPACLYVRSSSVPQFHAALPLHHGMCILFLCIRSEFHLP